MNRKISTVESEKKQSPKLEKYFNNPLCKRRRKKFRKRKKWETFKASKEKERIKIESFLIPFYKPP